VSRDQQCRPRCTFVTFGRIQPITHGLDYRPGYVREGPNRTLVHAKRIRAVIFTVCADSTLWVFGRVRAPWCAEQRHLPEQRPRQLQLTLSIHRLAIVRHSDERQSRKAARQGSTSGTWREWRPLLQAAGQAGQLPSGGPDGVFLVRLEPKQVMRRIDSARARYVVGVKPPSPFPMSPTSSVRCPASSRQRTIQNISPSASRAGAPNPVRSLAALHESTASARLRRPCGSFALEVDGCTTCRRVASDPELAMTCARGRAADTRSINADR